jgi:hypothetical protein
METRGFQFNAPAAARLENIQAPKFDFVSGASLVAAPALVDPGIDIWLKGQQQASENLLSGINIGVKGLSEGISKRFEYENEKELLKEEAKLEEAEDLNKFLQDVYLADLKSEDNTLKDDFTRLQIAEKKRELAAANLYDPLPETDTTGVPLAGAPSPEKGFGAGTGTGGRFSMRLSDLKSPDQATDGQQLTAEFSDAAPAAVTRTRYSEKEIGGGKVAIYDNLNRQIVPGTISDKETSAEVPTPEGFTRKGFTKKTKTGTETYEKEGSGSQMSDTMVTKLAAYSSLKDSIKDIEEQVKDMTRGPIVGVLREKNPYDVAAQKLNKLVESVVPGLAKTVFNEVGVLTDADVLRYKAMVPNVKTEAELADGLLDMLNKKIASGYESTLNAAEDAKIDVSGFRARQAKEKAATDKTTEQAGLLDEIKALREKVKTTGLVDTTRPALIQSIAAKTKEYIQKTGQSPKF